ncbi:MAG: M23 family metallopeptidase [Spirochaetales bacterium]|nr:M23 family metallopeptidase [Spirochaetales bacterium]
MKPERTGFFSGFSLLFIKAGLHKLLAGWNTVMPSVTVKRAGFIAAAAVFVLAGVFLLSVGSLPRRDILLPEDDQVYNDILGFLEPFVPSMGSGEYPFDENFVIPVNSSQVYQIQKGDTLSGIAAKYKVSVSTLVSYNQIDNVRRLMPGKVLKIPSIDGVTHIVKRGESIASISEKYSIKVNLILDANDLLTDVVKPGQELFIPGAEMNPYDLAKAKGELFIWPTRGRLTSGYGYRNDPFTGVRRFHYGIDVANKAGTKITASMAGRVVLVENGSTGYGKYVVIRHSYGGYQTLYGHLNTIQVRTNQWVNQGQVIGSMGSTGRSTGPHLHFSVYKNNRPVNPATLLH